MAGRAVAGSATKARGIEPPGGLNGSGQTYRMKVATDSLVTQKS